MDNYTDQKPKTGAGSDFDQAKRKSEINVNQSSFGSSSTLVYIVVALVLIFGALLLFTGNWGTTTPAPTATEDSATPPAPDATAPAPATPPAAESTAPAPATPPAAESTTPPATGTAPQQPAAPAQ